MRAKRLKKSHTPVDKSQLAFGTRKKLIDRNYLDSYRHRTCEASNNGIDLCNRVCIAAHCRAGEVAGIGTKPSDDLTFGLCNECHMSQEAQPGPEWWVENVLKPQMRRRYRDWKNGL